MDGLCGGGSISLAVRVCSAAVMRISPGAAVPEWSDLEVAFEADPELMGPSFYDRASGTVVALMPDWPEGGELAALIEGEPERFVRIERPETQVEFGWMEQFAATIADERVAARLRQALGGARPFRRFKDTLHGAGKHVLERWYAFSRVQRRRAIVAWLEEHDVEVGEAPPWPDLDEEPGPDPEELRRLARECIDRLPVSHLPRVAALLQELVERRR